MGQAFGLFNGSDGFVQHGSDNFSVEKQSDGIFLVTLNDRPNGRPIVVSSVEAPYVTAISHPGFTDNSYSFYIYTGYVDQSARMDVDFIHFVAYWK